MTNTIDSYVREPHPAERWIKMLCLGRKQPVFFDIGAGEGEDSVRFSKKWPNASIFTFEPRQDNCKLIEAHFKRFDVKNSKLFELALSDKEETSKLYLSTDSDKKDEKGAYQTNKSNSLLKPTNVTKLIPWLAFRETQEVSCQRFDAIATQLKISHIDFIHMDVQGFELKVLNGMGNFLKKTTAIWLEVAKTELYQDQPLESEVHQFMTKNGFDLVLELNRETEGDRLYLNSSLWRAKMCLLLKKLKSFLGK